MMHSDHNYNDNFDLWGEMHDWTRKELGRGLTTNEYNELHDSIESNMIYDEFFENLESVLTESYHGEYCSPIWR